MTRTMVKTCEYCGQEFTSPAGYAAHKRREHPGWREGLVPLLAEANGEATPEEEQAEHQDVEVEAEETTTVRLAYCPSCGLSIDRLQQALHGIEVGLSYCPGCGLDVVKVRQALEG